MNVIEVVHRPENGKLVCNIVNSVEFSNLSRSVKPDLIVHCASVVPKRLDDYNNNEHSLQNAKMLENIIISTDCPIVYISSMTVYGRSPLVMRNEGDVGNCESDYGRGKYDGEMLLRSARRDSLSIRIPGLFGGSRDTGLVANTLRAMKQGSPLNLPVAP